MKKEKKKTIGITLRLSPEEREIIQKSAAEKGLTLSAYIRMLALAEARKK